MNKCTDFENAKQLIAPEITQIQTTRNVSLEDRNNDGGTNFMSEVEQENDLIFYLFIYLFI